VNDTPRRADPQRPSRSSRQRADHLELGAQGEERAARYLARRGYRIVERNVRVGGVEVDLIVRRARLVAFVEVKTRSSDRLGRPEHAVDRSKQLRLVRAAAAWLRENPGRARSVRFDVVACQPPGHGGPGWRIDHWPGAFEAGD
jgi:putative endonuclease